MPAILINVDDNEAARYARTKVLQKAGFVVHEAGTGGEGLRLVGEVNADLVLLDVHLPDINGIDVCRRIKSREETASVIVLQLSASAISAPQATAALNTGADSYLIEPVDPDVLVATVRALLRLRTAERGLSEKNAELHSVNMALRRSNEDLEYFAYVASHDLQEPLRNITTHLELLERVTANQLDDSARGLFAVVQDGARRMRLLIHDVLAYSAIGKDARPLEAVSLEESLKEALENLRESIGECDAQVIAGELPTVYGDGRQLCQVFQNLVGNSIKYRVPGSRPLINITAERNNNAYWVIRAQDNGIGIAEPYLQKVFHPFKRLHGNEIPGNGIGLALCRRIVEGHGGQIWAESSLGGGSTFSFTLRATDNTASS